MTAPFSFSAPTQVRFGWGVRAELPAVAARGRWGMLTSAGMLRRDAYTAMVASLASQGVEVVQLGAASPNPRLGEVEQARQVAAREKVEGIIAVGGGSVIDAAKLLAAALRHGATAAEVLDDVNAVIGRPLIGTCPLIVVPTTAGTGAEVSQGAIITDEATGRKRAARSPSLIPTRAIIDPELTVSAPTRVVAEAGFDVIAHATETLLSRASTPVTDVLARAALDVAPGALLRVLNTPDDRAARTDLSLHAWLMGYNLAHASTCLPHRLQYPVGAATDSSHQIGLAALYPSWFRRVTAAEPARAHEVMELIRESVARVSKTPMPDEPGAFMRDLISRLGIAVTLGDLGLEKSSSRALADAVDGRIDLDPINPSRDVLVQMFEEAFSTT